MGLAGGYSDAAISVSSSTIPIRGAHALPMCGVGGTPPAAGWAQAIAYKNEVLEEGLEDPIALVLEAMQAAQPADFGQR
jgi:2-oxoisovalerate dehydrogenase E1 component